MKKTVLKKSLKLQLHRETLHRLEETKLLEAVVGGEFSVECTLTGSAGCTGTGTYVC
jgi:hypothetical protein